MEPLGSITCYKCGSCAPAEASFCPRCGRRLRSLYQSGTLLKQYLLVFGLALMLWSIAFYLSRSLGGIQPASQFAEKAEDSDPNYQDPVLERLRVNAKAFPQSKAELWVLANALLSKIKVDTNAPAALVFETLDTLRAILNVDAHDAQALLAMADLSFSQQAFGKAVEFYERYLETSPDDFQTRTKYANALTFMGKKELSIRELLTVLSKHPDYFNAMAYLSIAYAQNDETAKALETGQKALAAAPNDEAKARFSAFLDTIGARAAKPPSASERLAAIIKSNPIAAPKFKGLETREQGVVTLYFADFPINQMPPFAKEKFLGRIKEGLKEQGQPEIKIILFVDRASGLEMERLTLKNVTNAVD